MLLPTLLAICIQQAATTYHIPANLIAAIMHVEGGQKGSIAKNSNGTYDVGIMQINSRWLKTLKPYGITLQQLQNDSCTNIWVGTWLLRNEMAQASKLWQGIANYHSHTLAKNKAYQWKVWQAYQALTQ